MASITSGISGPAALSSGRRMSVSALLLAALLALLPAACGPEREAPESPHAAGVSQVPDRSPDRSPENPS